MKIRFQKNEGKSVYSKFSIPTWLNFFVQAYHVCYLMSAVKRSAEKKALKTF